MRIKKQKSRVKINGGCGILISENTTGGKFK